MTLKELAQRIHAHLRRLEANPEINVRRGTHNLLRFYNASARATGRYVAVQYISFQGASNLSKEEATNFLRALDDGSTERHHALGTTPVCR
jgi:hypothetical protein